MTKTDTAAPAMPATTAARKAERARLSVLTLTLEAAWADIQEEHPEVPNVAIVVGPVSNGGRAHKYGHYTLRRVWDVNGTPQHEVLISAEGLDRGGRQVFRTLLHESVHAYHGALSIVGTTQKGRHNDRFRADAKAFGLVTASDPKIGCTTPDITDDCAGAYAAAILRIERACRLHRSDDAMDAETLRFAGFLIGLMHLWGHSLGTIDWVRTLVPRRRPAKSPRAGANALKAKCACGRTIRVFGAVLDQGDIICDLCQEPFLANR